MQHSTTRRQLLASVTPAALATVAGASLLQRPAEASGYGEVTRRAYAKFAPEFDRIANTPIRRIAEATEERAYRDFRRALKPVTEHLRGVVRECAAEIPAGDTSEFDIKLGMLFIEAVADALNLPDECIERLR